MLLIIDSSTTYEVALKPDLLDPFAPMRVYKSTMTEMVFNIWTSPRDVNRKHQIHTDKGHMACKTKEEVNDTAKL